MTNKLKIVLYGTGGLLFEPIVERLTESYSDIIEFPIHAISRNGSQKTSSAKVKYFEANSEDLATFEPAVKDANVIINLAGYNWDPPIEAAVKYSAPLKLYIGPQFGSEFDKSIFSNTDIVAKFRHGDKWRKQGVKVIDLITSLFVLDGFLNLILFNFNKDTKTVDIYGDENNRFDISFLEDIAWSVGQIIRKGKEEGFDSLKDRIRISSQTVSVKDILQRFETKNDIKLTRNVHPKEELIDKAVETSKSFSWNDLLIYLSALIVTGPDTGLLFTTNDDNYVNPEQKVFKWTKLI